MKKILKIYTVEDVAKFMNKRDLGEDYNPEELLLAEYVEEKLIQNNCLPDLDI